MRAEDPLIDRVLRGDAKAFEEMVSLFEGKVYRLARHIVKDRQDAEEVTQDVFLTLFRKLHTFHREAALSSWIYRITVNAALMRVRARRREAEVALEDTLPAFTPAGRFAQPVVDWSERAEEEVLRGELREFIREAVDDLPEKYRVVVVLRDVEGLSSQEAADVLDLSVAAVKSRLHRARLILRKRLTDYFGGAGRPCPPANRISPSGILPDGAAEDPEGRPPCGPAGAGCI